MIMVRARRWAKRYTQEQQWGTDCAFITIGMALAAPYEVSQITAIRWALGQKLDDANGDTEQVFRNLADSLSVKAIEIITPPILVDFAPRFEDWKSVRAEAVKRFTDALDESFKKVADAERWDSVEQKSIEELLPVDFTIEDVDLLIRYLIRNPRTPLEVLARNSPPLHGKSKPPTWQWAIGRIDRISPLLGFDVSRIPQGDR
jgi:hypothetical protein